LINTICENALLAGYAQHAPTITSEIIDGVARDLRLGVIVVDSRNNAGARSSSSSSSSKEQEQNELLQAVKTLLEVRNRMMDAETKGRLQ
jgi:hypothetical protein